MSRADKYSKQRIDRLKELCVNHPDYLMQDLAEEMGLNVSDVFIIIKSYDLTIGNLLSMKARKG